MGYIPIDRVPDITLHCIAALLVFLGALLSTINDREEDSK